jgi:hypothetical protein
MLAKIHTDILDSSSAVNDALFVFVFAFTVAIRFPMWEVAEATLRRGLGARSSLSQSTCLVLGILLSGSPTMLTVAVLTTTTAGAILVLRLHIGKAHILC